MRRNFSGFIIRNGKWGINLMVFGLATVQQDNGAALLSRFQCEGNE